MIHEVVQKVETESRSQPKREPVPLPKLKPGERWEMGEMKISAPDENGQVIATFGPSMIVKPDGSRVPAKFEQVNDDADKNADSDK